MVLQDEWDDNRVNRPPSLKIFPPDLTPAAALPANATASIRRSQLIPGAPELADQQRLWKSGCRLRGRSILIAVVTACIAAASGPSTT